ncbi:glycine zipper 2TM domain-containing protein [Luteimonas viscosa]|uniref:Glycine zipper 2TM domain-containing protein n=1 Tax=Luteimonas viscosa TaxID=1132694 RepID=A0A5D4XR95_9GAMM|nr:glycine zipper 2TM domain-containing protein [Luteimonas viscosa]
MKSASVSVAIVLALAAGAVGAQVDDGRYGPAPYGDYSHRVPQQQARPDAYAPQGHHDWARVVRVDPVFDGRARPVSDTRRCRTRREGYAGNEPWGDRRADSYDGDYRNGYPHDPYRDQRRDDNGRLVATVLGGIAGAVLGSRIGDGSGQVIGTAVGSMVGGAAGRGIYEANRRDRDATVTVCEPDPYRGDGYGGYDAYGSDAYDGTVGEYDVTYEYGGREYLTRTNYHPGDRIRVRVDVRAE